ncbi:uncharacterized protein I303_100095 [Kwoniella dejecticola CBS 10117]|uniref:Uncharacterized protein n=1 Tax=Kwoniella dejecticola CBS 10117 TaxID=1296121 RepID=A0A1A6AE17_9TREE|nr:uncharacterized protein I303_00095 [Kwoniella dejecticola CBS 10117]OBR88284.1 hypothetical protein I303_00095 [Kwoniella dejecticola CBS 10117]
MTDNAQIDTQNTAKDISAPPPSPPPHPPATIETKSDAEPQTTETPPEPSHPAASVSPPPQSDAVPEPATITQQPQKPEVVKAKPKGKGKKVKARPRRRVVDSDHESDLEDGSDGSLTDPSSASEAESDTEDEEDEAPVKKDGASVAKAGEETSNINGNSAGTNSSVKGKGKGQKREYTEEETRKFEEIKAKRKAKQKAKKAELKKKKEAAKAAGTPVAEKKENVEGLVASTSNLKLDGNEKEPISSTAPLTQTTSRTSTSQRGRRGSKAHQQRELISDDPKVVPRQGKFWTHDQRTEPPQQLPARGLPDWRGRGVPRGGFRGGFRGRGFAPPAFGAGARGTAQGVELTTTDEKKPTAPKSAEGDDESEGDSEPVLEMDRLEKELAKKTPSAIPTQPKEKKWGHEAFEHIQSQPEKKPFSPPVQPAVRGGARGLPIRGAAARGGRGLGGRGGHFRQPLSSLPFHPSNLAATAAAAKAKAAATAGSASTSVADPTASAAASIPASAISLSTAPPSVPPTQPAPLKASAPSTDPEGQSTQPDLDNLLDETSQAVTIRLPGSAGSVEVTVGPTVPVSAEAGPVVETPELNESGQAILYTSPVPPPQPASAQLPSSVNPTMYANPNANAPSPYPAGSENGSMSSGFSHSQFVPTHSHPIQKSHLQQNVSASSYPPEFVPSSQRGLNGNAGQPRPFYPSNGDAPRSYPQQAHQQRPPIQPFYPAQQSYEYQPESQRGSFSAQAQAQTFYPQMQIQQNEYVDGRGSPFSAGSPSYAHAQNGQIGYFAPARQSAKISIKPPSGSGNSGIKGQSEKDYMQQQLQPTFATLNTGSMDPNLNQAYYPQQHYNPYTQSAVANGYEISNGNGYYVDANGYPTNGWAGAQGQVAYGYEGDYVYQ